MRYTFLLVLLASMVCGFGSEPTFEVIPNQTPSIAVPADWSYGSEPGTYFWNGFRTGAVIVAFCWIFALIRTAVCDDKEEL